MSLAGSTAFVTGSSGFLGRNLVPFLVSHGLTVRALVRSAEARDRVVSALKPGQDPKVIFIEGDLQDLPALQAGMQGAQLVFHCAAKAALAGPFSEFELTNVQGTLNVIEACRAAGVRRLVHVSTEATCVRATAWGGLVPMTGINEGEPLDPPLWAPYSHTKALAEQLVLAASCREGEPGLQTVVVRPHRLWGRGDTVILAALLGACRAGVWRWFTPASQTTATHVRNACRALLLAAERGVPGQAYFVTDGQVLDLKVFFTCYIQALAVLGRTVVVRDEKIRQELGFQNEIDLEQGLAEVAEPDQADLPRGR